MLNPQILSGSPVSAEIAVAHFKHLISDCSEQSGGCLLLPPAIHQPLPWPRWAQQAASAGAEIPHQFLN